MPVAACTAYAAQAHVTFPRPQKALRTAAAKVLNRKRLDEKVYRRAWAALGPTRLLGPIWAQRLDLLNPEGSATRTLLFGDVGGRFASDKDMQMSNATALLAAFTDVMQVCHDPFA